MLLSLRLPVLLAMTISMVGLASAAEVEGTLLDRMCSAKIVQQKDQKAALEHTRDCALMDDCVKSGYGVFMADGTFITFDSAGNAKVAQALKASKKEDHILVHVTGERSGDTMKVASIKIL